jgi:peptidoglycan/xylan/chitin deacetylase (PgdA/CDA1 family)
MSFMTALSGVWRKNSPEVRGLWDGSLPDFVTRRRPRELCGVPVFTYHLVEPQELEADLEFLAANGYRTLRAADLVDYLAGAWDPQGPAVMLTFDDGPRNFFDSAFPLLQRFGARAVAFIAPGLHADAGRDDTAQARPMSWQEMATIHASGLVEFQSHTFESRFVPQWPAVAPLAGCDPDLERRRRGAPRAFADDLALSRLTLESRFPGGRVDQIAFPMYVGTAAAVDAARALGFRACHWGLIPGRPINARGDSPFFISRLSDEFLRRLPGAGRITLRQLVRGRLHRIQRARAWRRQFACAGSVRPQRASS